MRAISTFSRDDGISTRACRAIVAFRMRDSMSAIGSVISCSSPRTFRHAGNVALERQLAEAQAAECELPHVCPRTAAAMAAVAQADLELRRLCFFGDLCRCSHVRISESLISNLRSLIASREPRVASRQLLRPK